MIAADIVDWQDILTVIWASSAAGVGLVLAGSLAIFGAARANTARREGQAGAATMYGVIGILGVLVCAAGVVLGVSVMLSKS